MHKPHLPSLSHIFTIANPKDMEFWPYTSHGGDDSVTHYNYHLFHFYFAFLSCLPQDPCLHDITLPRGSNDPRRIENVAALQVTAVFISISTNSYNVQCHNSEEMKETKQDAHFKYKK